MLRRSLAVLIPIVLVASTVAAAPPARAEAVTPAVQAVALVQAPLATPAIAVDSVVVAQAALVVHDSSPGAALTAPTQAQRAPNDSAAGALEAMTARRPSRSMAQHPSLDSLINSTSLPSARAAHRMQRRAATASPREACSEGRCSHVVRTTSALAGIVLALRR